MNKANTGARLDPSVYAKMKRSNLRKDMTTRAAYSSDASIFRRIPAAVLEPRSIDDIRDGLAIAREQGWKVVGRGGGTSVAGNAIGEGLIIDTSRYFNRILEIDPIAQTATVEPGVICDDLREAAAVYGLTYGPDPSTHSRCTIGGMVANNACGSHSVAYGTAAENLVSITLMLFDATQVTLSKGSASDATINEALTDLVASHEDQIRRELGRFPRQVSGYGLHYLLPEHGFDVAKAIAGSEGTTGIITQLEVKLVPVPQAKALAVLAFHTVFDAAAAAAKLRLPGVATIEGMGGDLLGALRSKVGQEHAGEQLPGNRIGIDAGGWLYCETTGENLDEAYALAEAVAASVPTVDHVIVHEPQAMRELWRIREAAAGLVTRLPDGAEAWPNWEDSAVPPENLADYLRDLYALMDKHHLRGIPFGHFGEGCVHVRISFDFSTESGLQTFYQFMEEAAALVSAHGGSLSGEHGDGRARSSLLGHMYSTEMLELFSEFKKIFDPTEFFNPGVLVAPDAISDGLRMAPGQRTHERRPIHLLEHDKHSLVNAINRCVGVSACRSATGAMCPSFQITGDEIHSTRGRARLFAEMFRGESITDGFRSQEVAEALDLCLSCKACASECPVNVDMATYKSEFLYQHYKHRLRPGAHYVMGWLPLLAHFAHKIPLLPVVIDKAMATPGLRTVIARVGGLDTTRPLIHFAHQSFRKWWKSHQKASGTRGTVVLWPDSFNTNLNTAPAQAAVEVLEYLGFEVIVPTEFVCCGLTWHSTGQLDMTKRVLEHTAKVMQPYLDQGLPVIGIEPSCTVMLQSEAAELSPAVEQLAAATMSFAEFVAPHLEDALAGKNLPQDQLAVLTQVHCHERSLGDPSQTSAILRALGVDESQIATGCCGLAGNWGFEKGHGPVSMALGERELFPAVRESVSAGKQILADGFSCRTQIEQGTGTRAVHLAELLRDILCATQKG